MNPATVIPASEPPPSQAPAPSEPKKRGTTTRLKDHYSPREGTRTASISSRINLDRTKKKVFVPQHARRGRHLVRWPLLTVDAALVISAQTALTQAPLLSPITWVCGLVIFLCGGLGVYLTGGYRLEGLAHGVALKILTAVAVAGSLFGGLALRGLQASTIIPDSPYIGLDIIAILAVSYGAWVALSRGLLRSMLRAIDARAKLVVIGDKTTAQGLASALRSQGRANPVIHLCDVDAPVHNEISAHSAPIKSLDEQLQGWIKAIVIEGNVDELPQDTIADLVHARLCNVPIISPAQLHEELWERVPIAAADRSWVFTEGPFHNARNPLYLGSKRLIDIAASTLGIIALLPVFTAVAIAIKVTSPGPILFRQIRVGLGKQEFKICKFRTMRTDAEKNGAQWATTNDNRITKIGAFLRKSRLDELPQFWNVLMGDMTLVGPRPERPEFNEQLEELVPYYDLRHLVKPGITGWAQVCYPYGASVDDAIAKLEYDCYYLKHAGMWLDARIIFRTIAVCLGLRGR